MTYNQPELKLPLYLKSNKPNHHPQLIFNNPSENISVLSEVIAQLTQCNDFMFVVAFITESGLATLKSYLLDLHRKGVRGKILTSTYLSFNNPKVFKELMKLQNVEVRLSDLQGFHSKGYIFNFLTDHSLIIGSTNLTANALKMNYEWNVQFRLQPEEQLMLEIQTQFDNVWNDSVPLTESWIAEYEKVYVNFAAKQYIKELFDQKSSPSTKRSIEISDIKFISPNKMQQHALDQINELRNTGARKGLIISATGTGKTYLSAFDVQRFAPHRMLFVVHREQILTKAMEDYKKIVGGNEDDFGLLTGSSKDFSARYLFATIQTISKADVLQKFSHSHFDYILIDEVHKAGASSYQKLIDYFQPQFLMGMTATPERTDDFNIYQLFDYNIAYEIRLQEALEEDMLCPFHYFGVTDFEYNGQLIDDEFCKFNDLLPDERVAHILEKIEYYGYSGSQVRGLIFCSKKEEAHQLARKMNEQGYHAVALTGDDSIEYREQNVQKLENGQLEYIITVDIFNEGIDIPSINQVVMLRQTQSSIIFIQQLGRGLRKHHSKEFVTIIDFIGNYKNNYLIPIALSGDRSLNKDTIRRKMKTNNYISGISTINFEEVAKQQVYKAISNSQLNGKEAIKQSFKQLKNKIGRTPMLVDFIDYHSIDPNVIIDAYGQYYSLLKVEKLVPAEETLTEYEIQVLTMLSSEILPGKRLHEIVLLDLLLKHEMVTKEMLLAELQQYHCQMSDATFETIKRVFTLDFFISQEFKKYGSAPIVVCDDESNMQLSATLKASLNRSVFYKSQWLDLVQTAFKQNNHYNNDDYLTLNQKYVRKETLKLLNWKKSNADLNISGYTYNEHHFCIFVTYNKSDSVKSSINYQNQFVSNSTLSWVTKNKRTMTSPEVQLLLHSDRKNVQVHLFVKKSDDIDGSEFYYLGRVKADASSAVETSIVDEEGRSLSAVCMGLHLEQPVEHHLYQYLVSN